jgi:hypothetical protein
MDNISLNPQQIQQMIQMLQSMLPPQETKAETNDHEAVTNPTNNNIKANDVSRSRNKFDDMPERRMHKEDVEVDKKLATQPPVPRARKFNLIKVSCRVCGKKEEVNPVLITDSLDRYKCNRCSGTAG